MSMSSNISRTIEIQVAKSLSPGKAVVVLGPRRVGKTTLIKNVVAQQSASTLFLNCDDPEVRSTFTNINLYQLKQKLQHHQLIVFDEAQRIENIGLVLKLIVDELPEKLLLVSGSSSLNLSNQISEPLTGRKKTFNLFSMSILELYHHQRNPLIIDSQLEDLLRFGSYPHLFSLSQNQDKQDYLLELSGDYLYQDVLEYQSIRNPEQLRRLLEALALQIGQEVSYTELGSLLGLDQKTVVRYLDLLEKSYVVFRLSALSRNHRTEISKSRKIYFYDLGIRNAIIKNFNSLHLRNDLGQLWENFVVVERIKRNHYLNQYQNYYFWRTYSQQEIDFVEESQGKMTGYEIKWSARTKLNKLLFSQLYPDSDISLVNRDNYLSFLIE